MSLTLGEKLRQAREARKITISEVAEQTRISALYLESIDNNDYRGLPGGIFNKGFVKSYAKYVGVDEQEALRDYAQIISDQGDERSDENKNYRPQVLTDDHSTGSMIPTLIFAAIILGLLSWGVISLVKYLNTPNGSNANTSTSDRSDSFATNVNSSTTSPSPQMMPASNEIKVEFVALSEPISLESTVDGKKLTTLAPVSIPQTFNAKESVLLRYYRGFTPDKIKLTVNGKEISTPANPANPKLNGIEFEINKENVQEIWQNGTITLAESTPPSAETANANVADSSRR